jgi:hypothetical protein
MRAVLERLVSRRSSVKCPARESNQESIPKKPRVLLYQEGDREDGSVGLVVVR